MANQKWNKEMVVSAILELHRGGKKLNPGYMQRNHRSLYNAGHKHWKGWQYAIEAAGLEYDDVYVKKINYERIWDKDTVVEEILHLHAAGQELHASYMRKNRQKLYAGACRCFGSWSQAITGAGLDYSQVRKKVLRVWSKAAVAEAIVQRIKKGHSIRASDIAKEDIGLYEAAGRHFGKRRSGERYYGAWRNAVRVAGFNYNKIQTIHQPGWWTKARVTLCIRNLERRGLRLNSVAIQYSHGGLYNAAIKYFDSWSTAVKAAGIPYRKHRLTWSTQEWLQELSEEEYKEKINSTLRTKRRSRPLST